MKKEGLGSMVEQTKNQSWAITLFAIGVFMAALDNGIISAALTTINDDFGVSANWGAWGVTLYTLGLAISVPVIGKLSDRYGRKKLFIIEIALFGIGSLLVALSPNFTFYLIARFIQALGGGGIFIIGSSHVLSTLPAEKQGRALGMLGGMNGIAAVLGPNIGSVILDLTGKWHFLFFINVPIAALLIIFGALKLTDSKEPTSKKLDLVGTVLLSFAILGVMYGLTNLEGVNLLESILSPNVYGFVLAGIVLFVALLVYEGNLEKRGGDPILPIRLLKQARYLITLLIGSFSGALLAGMIFIPAFSEQVLGIAQENAGYWMTPLAIAAGVGAALGGVLVDKRGPIMAVVVSGAIAAIGFALFPLWIEAKWQFIVASFVAGAGMGIILGAPLNILATERLENDKGSALATLSLLRQIGLTIAPTIYAGFIARGYNELPTILKDNFANTLQENLQGVQVDPAQIAQLQQAMGSMTGQMTQQDMTAMMANIQDPALAEAIQKTMSELTMLAAQNGYSGLFYTAAIIAAGMIVLAVILKPVRAKMN